MFSLIQLDNMILILYKRNNLCKKYFNFKKIKVQYLTKCCLAVHIEKVFPTKWRPIQWKIWIGNTVKIQVMI